MGRKNRYTGLLFSKISRVFTLLGDALEKPMAGLDKLVNRLPISEQAKSNFSVRKYGILGTISFHLLLLVLVLLIIIHSERSPKPQGIVFDIKNLEEVSQMLLEEPKLPDQGEENARNIAVEQSEDKIESFEDYKNYQVSEQVVENLAKSSVDEAVKSIIAENNLDPYNKELPDIATEELKMYRAEKIEEEQVYKGATNIYYVLDNRKVVKLEVPVYKCEGGGLVKLDIRVNRRGKVEWVSVDTAESNTSAPCLLNAAKDAAMKTRFTLNQAAPILQQGSLTYRFIAQ